MNRNAALRYDQRIKSHTSPPKRPRLHLLKAKGGDVQRSRCSGRLPARRSVSRPCGRLKGTVAAKKESV